MHFKRFLFVVVIAFLGSLLPSYVSAQDQDEVYLDVDVDTEYPGGLEALYQFISRNIVYPIGARKNGIQGTSYIEFVVNKSGLIDAASVKTVRSSHPYLDEEAIRVLRLSTVPWKPGEKNGKPVSQKRVIPVVFKLDAAAFEEVSKNNRLKKPIKTVTIPKTFHTIDSSHWTLFATRNLKNAIGRVEIGNTVEVIGWSAWAFFIKDKDQHGYVSWKSLKIIPELDSLNKVVANSSYAEQEKQTKFVDSTYFKLKPEAHLSVTASKRSTYVGDCITLSLAFNVKNDNPVALQFYDLGIQLADMLSNKLSFDKCWVVNGHITDIAGEELMIDTTKYITYKFYEGSYCPTVAGALTIPVLRLYMGRVMPSTREIIDSVNFYSKQLSIKVLPVPAVASSVSSDGYPIVGTFKIKETVSKESVAVGEIMSYRITISGKGLTFPIEPPKTNLENVVSSLREIIDSDTLVSNELTSSKTFVYDLIFNKPGAYDLGKVTSFKYFDSDTKKSLVLKGSKTIMVADKTLTNKYKPDDLFYTKNNFIAFDASQSMQIEDYEPYRLAAVKNGIEGFLKNRKTCDIGLIAFGGEAKHLNKTNQEQCYPLESLAGFGFDQLKKGTAIGDVVWLAKNSFANNTLPKRLVIIGDGDNTAGHLSPKFAADIAKKFNIKIFTIGIGHTGYVKYGVDQNGKPNMIDRTYSDKDFKKMASITGGQFYRAKDEDDLTRILGLIFK